jgi:hypothetical protein
MRRWDKHPSWAHWGSFAVWIIAGTLGRATRGRAVRLVGVSAIVGLGFATASSAATAGWSELPLPTRHALTPYEVSCASRSTCFAVGQRDSDLFVRYEGTRAQRLAGPRIRSSINALACPSATACIAVGMSGRRANHGLAALRWSKGRWSTMSLPARPGRSLQESQYQLGGLSCPSTRMCVAVGDVQSALNSSHPVTRPLLFRWNGRRWSSVQLPLTTAALRSVSCASATACTAVGFAAGTHGTVEPAVVRLHGGRWTRVRLRSRVVQTVGGSLVSISCATASRCLATGVIVTADAAGAAVTRVVILQETGGGWSTEVPPLPTLPRGDHPNDLEDNLTEVSCGAPGSCLGVGTSVNDRGEGTGAGMSLVLTPTKPRATAQTRAGDPTSVSCPTAAFCLVGGYRSINRYTP